MCTDCYKSIFSGKTKAGEQIVLYQNGRGDRVIKRGNSPSQALDRDAIIVSHIDPITEHVHLKIRSRQWIGEAVATRFDMGVGDGLNLPVTENHIVRGEE